MNKLLKIMMLGAFVTTAFAMEGDEALGRLKDNYMTAKTQFENG